MIRDGATADIVASLQLRSDQVACMTVASLYDSGETMTYEL